MKTRLSLLIITVGVVLAACALALVLWGGCEFHWTSALSASTVRKTEVKIEKLENWKIQLLFASSVSALVIGSALLVWSHQTEAGMSPSADGFSFKTILEVLRKSARDRNLCGVCGGLGEHTPIPSIVWRMLFLALSFIYGIGLAAYVILWICMPSASQPDGGKPETNGHA